MVYCIVSLPYMNANEDVSTHSGPSDMDLNTFLDLIDRRKEIPDLIAKSLKPCPVNEIETVHERQCCLSESLYAPGTFRVIKIKGLRLH